jgi:hypothetical protein
MKLNHSLKFLPVQRSLKKKPSDNIQRYLILQIKGTVYSTIISFLTQLLPCAVDLGATK